MSSPLSRFKWMLLILFGLSGAARANDPCSSATVGHDNSPSAATLSAARENHCAPTSASCNDLDAVVFVHGIYGSDSTFVNARTHFDWPREFPSTMPNSNRGIDVFRLDYQTALLSWASAKNPDFVSVACAVKGALKPLRVRGYRSIGFIAHSLGGNIVSTYIHMVKTSLGHPQRSQNAFVITLATPVLGAQIADEASDLKRLLHMNDDLLDSLKKGNLYLRMLEQFREEEVEKEQRYVCRPVHLHAAYEEKYLGPLLIVNKDSAALSISQLASSPVVGFPLNHSEMAKPAGPDDPIYKWVLDRMSEEYIRIGSWEHDHSNLSREFQLCERIPFIPE
jgi:hypothetical protein